MMRDAIERTGFAVCRVLGSLLRAGKYSMAWIVDDAGVRHVRKRRMFHAPLVVWIGGPLMRALDTGVRVLPQGEWEERERRLYWTIYGASIRIDADGTLVLPCLEGKTLATVLENPAIERTQRNQAIEAAILALAELHRRGFTHADAMAENVMIDLESGSARWFDFETVHEESRPVTWRRADDVRALLATCLLRTPSGSLDETLRLVLETYADADVTAVVAGSFASVFRRPLAFHLAQAGLSFEYFLAIRRLVAQS
jgi:serine/threonine protein kinase